MSSELAFNTYVLVGNALNCIMSGKRAAFQTEFGVPEDAFDRLYRIVEPLQPDKIIRAIGALTDSERALLGRCCHYCLRELGDDELAGLVGLPRDVIEAVMVELSLESTHA